MAAIDKTGALPCGCARDAIQHTCKPSWQSINIAGKLVEPRIKQEPFGGSIWSSEYAASLRGEPDIAAQHLWIEKGESPVELVTLKANGELVVHQENIFKAIQAARDEERARWLAKVEQIEDLQQKGTMDSMLPGTIMGWISAILRDDL